LAFQGCISTAGKLAYGTPAEVRQTVQETLDIMKPTYSYMLAPTHMIQDNTPTENAVEMYDAAKELGWY
jgi:uroporphyrinogen decarboxylase